MGMHLSVDEKLVSIHIVQIYPKQFASTVPA